MWLKFSNFMLLSFLWSIPPVTSKSGSSTDIIAALDDIFNNYIVPNNYCVLINTNFSHLHRLEDVQGILNKVLHCFNVPFIIEHDVDNGDNICVNLKIYIAETKDDVFKVKRNLHRGQVRSFTIKYLIILLQKGTRSEILSTVELMFKYFFHLYITDVNILIDGAGSIEMYTYYPYRLEGCKSTEPILVKNFSSPSQKTHLQSFNIFPEKFKNFFGCPLKVITWQIHPFVIYDSNFEGGQEEHFKGFDMTLLKTFAEKLNFSLDIEKNKPAGLLGGNIYDNGTITGAYKLINSGEANISIGCSSCMPIRLQLFSSVSPYFQMQFVIVVKAKGHYTSLQMVLFPFDRYTWCLLFTFSTIRYLLLSLKKYRSFPEMRKPIASLAFCIWIIFVFILRISFEGSFFKLLHNAPLKPLPTKFSEVVSQKYSIITDHAKYRMLHDLSILLPSTRIVQGEPKDALKALENATSNTAVFTSVTFFAYYLKNNPKMRQELFMVKEPVVESMLCMYFPRFSFIVNAFERELIHLRTVGLIDHFFKPYEAENLPVTSNMPIQQKKHNDDLQPINMEIFDSIFQGLLVIQCLAFCIFLIEILSVKFVWLKKILRKW